MLPRTLATISMASSVAMVSILGRGSQLLGMAEADFDDDEAEFGALRPSTDPTTPDAGPGQLSGAA